MSPRPSRLFKTGKVGLRDLFYERRSSDDVWGDLASDEAVEFWFDQTFHIQLTNMVKDIEKYTGEEIKGLISAGAYVDKPGMHAEGRAFDLDGIIWERDEKEPWKATDFYLSSATKMYFHIQAICLMHFGTVLGYQYNKAHEDHIHIDNGQPPGFRHNSRSIVLFIQGASNVIFGTSVDVDGSWGPKTWSAMKNILELDRAEGTRYPTENQYTVFLQRCARDGNYSAELETQIEELESELERLRLLLRRA